jgi:hypothetical protein
MSGVTIMSEFRADAWGVGGLFVEGLAVTDTAALVHLVRPHEALLRESQCESPRRAVAAMPVNSAPPIPTD